MPRGCKWHYVSDYFIDSMCCSQQFSMYVAKDGKGNFHYKGSGAEDGFMEFDRIDFFVDFFAGYGDDTLLELRDTVSPLKGYEAVVRMIDFRLKSTEKIAAVAGR